MPSIDNIPRLYATATIAASGTTSDAVDCTRNQFVGFYTPASLTGTAITFTASNDNSTYVTVLEVGGAATYSVTAAASRYIPLDPRVFAGAQYVKLVSGSTEASARSITCVLRPVS
jgi:glucose dehydrogenase